MGMSFGPMSALLPEHFPTNTRYTGCGVAYNLASILGAALTPFVATWLAQRHGPGSVGIYLALLGIVSLVALFLSKETRLTNLDTMTVDATAAEIESTSP
jgi:MFS family permease